MVEITVKCSNICSRLKLVQIHNSREKTDRQQSEKTQDEAAWKAFQIRHDSRCFAITSHKKHCETNVTFYKYHTAV